MESILKMKIEWERENHGMVNQNGMLEFSSDDIEVILEKIRLSLHCAGEKYDRLMLFDNDNLVKCEKCSKEVVLKEPV